MQDGYTIRLAAKNEGVEYRDGAEVYRFNAALDHGVWTVHLPGTKGEAYLPHELTADEEARILPRIRTYLGEIWWLGFWRRRYMVEVHRGSE